MNSLIDIFEANIEHLRKQVQENPEPKAVYDTTSRFLDKVADSYKNPEHPTKERNAIQLVALVKSAMAMMLSVNKTELWKQQETASMYGGFELKKSKYDDFIRILQLAFIVFGLVFTLLLQFPNYGFFFALLSSIAISELIRMHLNKKVQAAQLANLDEEIDQNTIKRNTTPKITISVESNGFIADLRSTFYSLHKTINRLDYILEESSPNSIEEDNQLLELMQGFIEAYETSDGKHALINAKMVPNFLRKHDIQTVYFDGSNEVYFQFLPNLSSKKHETITPALLKDGKLLAHGKVLKPN